ncbi:hypothetical protein ACFW04_013592 [Cataglyphis niger]
MPISNRTEVVYKINCKNCSASYIGQTKRHLSTRIKEHFNNIKMHASNLSVISKHKLEFDHDFDWSAPDILHNEKHVRKREMAEICIPISTFTKNYNIRAIYQIIYFCSFKKYA